MTAKLLNVYGVYLLTFSHYERFDSSIKLFIIRSDLYLIGINDSNVFFWIAFRFRARPDVLFFEFSL